jgi:hypothetical protein
MSRGGGGLVYRRIRPSHDVDYAVRLRYIVNAVTAFPQVVDRGGIDPPTFRFSGGRSSD